MYDFDTVHDRTGRGQNKWEPAFLERRFGHKDLLSFWVADMDFKADEKIRQALAEAAEHGMYGYTDLDENFFAAYMGWMQRRHNCTILREWIMYSGGVVPAVNVALQAFSEPGDEVLIQRPVYYPFTHSILAQNRKIANNALLYKDGEYTVDFADFEAKVKNPACKLFILCNPHNPTGRVFTEAELRKMGELCMANNVFVLSDEIHADLITEGHTHIVFSNLGKEFADNSMICHAPSKTFNLAGLKVSCILFPDPKRRAAYQQKAVEMALGGPNYFGPLAATVAWNQCGPWLDAVMEYIAGNFRYLEDFIEANWKGKVRLCKREGTYLAWLDLTALTTDAKALETLLMGKAKVALDEGYIFGDEGAGFERINMACPRSLLVELLRRMDKVLREEFHF